MHGLHSNFSVIDEPRRSYIGDMTDSKIFNLALLSPVYYRGLAEESQGSGFLLKRTLLRAFVSLSLVFDREEGSRKFDDDDDDGE